VGINLRIMYVFHKMLTLISEARVNYEDEVGRACSTNGGE
jgi:hypothetical protein